MPIQFRRFINSLCVGWFTLFFASAVHALPVFINEIHYDNSGADLNEGFEIAGPADTNLSGWQLVLYNGSNGQPYDTLPLEGVIADLANGFGVLSFPVSGVQNGSPDAVALVDNLDQVLQFLSYEGVVNAASGIASGLTSTDIMVEEDSDTAADASLQLMGLGSSYADFQWAVGVGASFGAINPNQTLIADSEGAPVDSPSTLLLYAFLLMLVRRKGWKRR